MVKKEDMDERIINKKVQSIDKAVEMICDLYKLTDVERMKYFFTKYSTEVHIILCKMIKTPEDAIVVIIYDSANNKVRDFKIIKDNYYGFNYDFGINIFSVVSKKFSLSCDLKKHFIRVLSLVGDEGSPSTE